VVEMLESKDNLSHVEGRDFFCEHSLELQMVEKLATLSILKDEIQALVVLESVKQFDHKWMAID
jgi:hypothetical protein